MQIIMLPRPAAAPSTTWNDNACREWLRVNVPGAINAFTVNGEFAVSRPDPPIDTTAIIAGFAAFTPPADTRLSDQETREANLRTAVAIVRSYPTIASPSAAQRLAFERAIARVVSNLVRERLSEDGAD